MKGATLNAMLATIKSDGQPVEAEWPYIKRHHGCEIMEAARVAAEAVVLSRSRMRAQ